uniref:Dicer-like protein 1 n=1 Tax=Bionectria ochroleuca TaxID=29856 RepID=A0A8H7KCB9_BIOOC
MASLSEEPSLNGDTIIDETPPLDESLSDDEDDDAYRLNVNPENPERSQKRNRELSKPMEELAKETEKLSLSRMFDDGGTRKIIATPEKNIIVVLDTGSGKTLIAVLLMRHILEREQESIAQGRPKKVAFFIVDKNALCYQQHSVLRHNLEFPIAKLHGEVAGLRSSKEFWDSQLEENMAIVCTAQLLLDALRNGFISMTQVNLLIFDEAHHAKKNHPYARIIKNYYMRQPDESRPRILGMTASPVDAQTRDMRAAAAELELMLCSEIATVSDAALLQGFEQRKLVESVEWFDGPPSVEESKTGLWEKISEQVSYNPEFRPALEYTKDASSVLGPWCADRYWSLFVTDTEIVKLVAKTERDHFDVASAADHSDKAVSAVQNVKEILKSHEIVPVSKGLDRISPKVKVLWEILENAFHRQETSRAIIFVEQRPTAVLLTEVFQQPGMEIEGLMPSYMIGTQSVGSSWPTMTFRDQIVALQKFKSGETNCLFATPVAEEGIDVPECDLVIRFDLYNSVIQYIQSRGRARQTNSRYINMIETANIRDLRRLKQASRDSNTLRQFCAALPSDRKVQDGTILDSDALVRAEQIGQKSYETELGARLSFENSIEVLEKFVSTLTVGIRRYFTEYIVMPAGKKFVADIILPESCPVSRVTGHPQRNKQLSRYSAAFEACMILIKKKFINGHLQSSFAKKLPAMRNARLAISPNKKAEYPMLVKPQIWSELEAETPTQLFPTILAIEHPQGLGRQSRPLLLLSRKKIPSIPAIPLFFGNGHSSHAMAIPAEHPLELSPAQVDDIATFTLKVFIDLFSKEYEAGPSEIPYFFAPIEGSHSSVIAAQEAVVDWACLKEMLADPYLSWKNRPDEFFRNRFARDPLDGSRKLIFHDINKTLTPNDPTPAYAPPLKSRAYREVAQIIKEYSNSLYIKGRKQAVWDDDQPVIDAELMSLRRNFLDQFFVDDARDARCCVIPEPLDISSIPMDIISMANLLPALLFQLDQYLIALEVCSLLGLDILPGLALEAITKDGMENEDDSYGQKNYERLEFLGDTFLKMSTTIALFTLKPESTEYEYHVERMLLVCNNNLFNHAVDRELQKFIRSKSFDRRIWYPNLKLKKGKAPKLELHHDLADKSIADVCEALIVRLKAVTAMVKSKKHKMQSFAEYYQAYKVPGWHFPERVPTAHEYTAQAVGKKVGYTFESPSLARSAFKHPSWTWDNIPNYQQLEFLGDALLDMSIVNYLFRTFPKADPQWLTEHKMAMVSNQFLGFLCVRLDLHPHMMSTTASLAGQVSQYISDLEMAEETAKAQAEATGTDMPLVGAMFVDAKYDYDVVHKFFTRHILPFFVNMNTYDSFASNHPVTGLSQRLGGEFTCTGWRLCASAVPCGVEEGVRAITESDELCALVIHGTVVEHATAKTGRHAKVAVATKALDRFSKMDKEQFKAEFGCDCGAKEQK